MIDSGSIRPIRMPKWGLSMQEGTLVRWTVSLGERIEAGAPLCDIETAKITNEFESPAGGTVARLLAEPDEIVPIGRLIAILAEEPVDEAAIDALVAAEASVASDSEPNETAPQLRRVEAGGGRLAYLEAGEGPGTAIVFVHGFGGDHANWMLNQGALSQARRTIAFDLPGHGASDKTIGDGDAGALAAPLAAALDVLELGRVHLVAHSFGTAVAAALVAARPDRVLSAVLVAPLAYGASASPAYVEGFVAAERKRDLKPVMELLFSNPDLLSREMVNAALHVLRDDQARAALRTIAGAMQAASRTVFPDSLPVRVIWGDRDRVVPMPAGVREMLGGRLEIVAGAGHMPHVECAAAVNALIASFLPG